jgi:transposase
MPDLYRPTLSLLYGRLCELRDDLKRLSTEIEVLVRKNPACTRLMALEGVGPISSVMLFATLGTDEAFVNGRQFSAYLGLTPKQYSSGGKVNLVGPESDTLQPSTAGNLTYRKLFDRSHLRRTLTDRSARMLHISQA